MESLEIYVERNKPRYIIIEFRQQIINIDLSLHGGYDLVEIFSEELIFEEVEKTHDMIKLMFIGYRY